MSRSFPVGAALLLLGGAAAGLPADAYQEQRVASGLRLFRALLAADVDLSRKTLGDGRLLVLFFYTDDRKRAEELAKAFGKEGAAGAEPIRGLPVALEATADHAFAGYGQRLPAGIFLTQAPSAEALRGIVRFGIANHLAVYSPFEGHVESGVLGGLAVEAQVRPYVNLTTLAASNITLKEIFLKVAKVYR